MAGPFVGVDGVLGMLTRSWFRATLAAASIAGLGVAGGGGGVGGGGLAKGGVLVAMFASSAAAVAFGKGFWDASGVRSLQTRVLVERGTGSVGSFLW